MKPIEILDALMSQTVVKVHEDVFESLCEDLYFKPINSFTVYQIELGSVNLYSELVDDIYYNVLFEDVETL